MSSPARDSVPHRRPVWWQILFFAVILTLIALANAFTTLTDHARLGHPLAPLDPFIWEFSSVLVVGALIPLLALFSRRVPINARTWRWALPAHLVATLPFSIVHVAAMVALRKLIYAALGGQYIFGPVLSTWLYEYRKDFVTYSLLLAGLYGLSAWFELREKRKRAADAVAPDANAGAIERLVVRKLNREFILNVAEIDRIEASGNYVNVHAGGVSYRLRESLASLSRRLDARRFVQVHRSHIVNIDRIREIQPWDHGDYRILLEDGGFINFSRRYRGRLSHLFNTAPAHPPRDAAQP